MSLTGTIYFDCYYFFFHTYNVGFIGIDVNPIVVDLVDYIFYMIFSLIYLDFLCDGLVFYEALDVVQSEQIFV